MNFDTIRPVRVVILGAFVFLAILGLIIFANFDGFDSGQDEVGSVSIWGVLPERAVNAQLASLKDADRAFVGVSYEEMPLATFGEDLAEALAIGQGPDMVLISQELLASEQNKLAVIPFDSIPQRDYLDSFVPITELYLTSAGTYGVPTAVDPLVMYYNRAHFAGAGIPQPPTTWEAVTGMGDRITQRQGGTITRSLLAFGEYENVPNARAILSLLLMQAGSPITQVTNGRLESAITRSSSSGNPVESALSFYTQFADPAKTAYSWNRAMPDARQAFLAGDLAIYFGYASEAASLRAGNPNLDFDMAPVPQPQSATSRITYARAYAFAIPKTSQNPSGALLAAEALAEPVHAYEGAQALGMAPAARSALRPRPEDRFQPVFYPEALIARGWLSPSPEDTDAVFGAMIRDITTGRRSVGQALFSADQALNAAL